jgi:phosphate transport system protein
MQRQFEVELEDLHERILEMGGLVQQAIHLSVVIFKGGNSQVAVEAAIDAATEVIDRVEPRVNVLHREIDRKALDILALQHVVASDLRFVTAATRIGSDLEEMSDRAVNIARRTLSILSNPDPRSNIEIPRMAQAVEAMVRGSMDAFARRDEQLARLILKRDEEVDRFHDMVFQELIIEVTSETRFIQQALDLILISRNLERIADHATNIAESVVFMIVGEDIRHRYNVAGGPA